MKSWQTYLQVWESLASRRSQDFVKKKKKESQQSAQNSTSTDHAQAGAESKYLHQIESQNSVYKTIGETETTGENKQDFLL